MNSPAPVQIERTSAWHMYRAIVGIGAFCALIIVTVFQVTAERIAENQARFLAQAVAEVLPAAEYTIEVGLNDAGQLEKVNEAGKLPVFLGYGENGALVGAVITAQGMGYQDNVRILYSYSFDLNAIIGFKVLETKETPGLGDKIETEAHFIANFEALDVRLTVDGGTLQNPITTVKQGKKTEPWQIDGITGATITSDAIGLMLNLSASDWVPILERDAPALRPEQDAQE